jgi:hypothetical protein
MRYSESTKCIFKVAKGLFGGATLRFLSGWKNEMQIAKKMTKRGYFSPSECQALLPVPSEIVLDKFQPLQFDIPKRLKPGVYSDFIEIAVNSNPSSSSLILKFDGRRIRPGFEDDEVGDIDLNGCESSFSLADQLKKHNETLDVVKNCIEKVGNETEGSPLISSLKNVLALLTSLHFNLKKKHSMQRSLAEKLKSSVFTWVYNYHLY